MADISLEGIGAEVWKDITAPSSQNKSINIPGIGPEIWNDLFGKSSPEETPKPKPKPRGFIAETASALGAGLAQTGEGIAGTAEMVGIPGAGTARKYFNELQDNTALARPDYLKEGTVLDQPTRLADWRWWVRSLGENLPNMATMMIPGVGAIKGAQALNWGKNAIRAAGLSGSFGGSFTLEAGSAYSQAKEEMGKTGQFDAAQIEKVATMEGMAAGTANAIIELFPFNNLFLKQAGADRLVKRIVRQTLLEGGTEVAQEAVNVMVEKMGHKPDQAWSDQIGRLLEAGIIGGAMGGAAGGTVGTRVHSNNVKMYNKFAEDLNLKDDIAGWKAEGLPEKDIVKNVSDRLSKITTELTTIENELQQDPDAEKGNGISSLAANIDPKEMVSYVLYGQGGGIKAPFTQEPGMIGRQMEGAKEKIYRSMGMKMKTHDQTSAKPTSDQAPMSTSAVDSKTIATEPQRQADLDETKKAENKIKGANFLDALTNADLTEQTELEAARLNDIAQRDAETQRLADEETNRTNAAVADAQGQQAVLKTTLAGDDVRKQGIVDEVLGLSEKQIMTAVRKELGLTINPAGPDTYAIDTPQGPQPVNLFQIRGQLSNKRIADFNTQEAKNLADAESVKTRLIQEQLRKEERATAGRLKISRDTLNMNRTLTDAQRQILDANRDQLTPPEIAKLDKPPAKIPQSVQILTGMKQQTNTTPLLQEENPVRNPAPTESSPPVSSLQEETNPVISETNHVLSETPNPDYTPSGPDDETARQVMISTMMSQLDNAGEATLINNPDDNTYKRLPAGVDWLTDANKGGKAVSKADARAVLVKAQNNEALTPRQKEIHDAIIAAAETRGTGSEIASGAYWEEKGFVPVPEKTINVDDLVEGDRFVIRGEEFSVTDIDDQGNATLKDGTIRKVREGTTISDVDFIKQEEEAVNFGPEENAPRGEEEADTKDVLKPEAPESETLLKSEDTTAESNSPPPGSTRDETTAAMEEVQGGGLTREEESATAKTTPAAEIVQPAATVKAANNEESRVFLTGDPVATISGNEFEKSKEPITKMVAKWFSEHHEGKAINPVIGDVVLDERGVKDSIGHGLGRDKAAAFALVPGIITGGKILNYSDNWEGRSIEGFVIGAPVAINGEHHVGIVVVRKSKEAQRFYLHEVYLTEKLQKPFKTGAFPSQGERKAGGSGVISKLLDNIFEVKGKEEATVNTEPSINLKGLWSQQAIERVDKEGNEIIGPAMGQLHSSRTLYNYIGEGKPAAEDVSQLKSAGFSSSKDGKEWTGPTVKTEESSSHPVLYSAEEQTNVQTEKESFGKQLDDFREGKLKSGEPLTVGNTPRVLTALGAEQLPVVIDQSTLKKVMDGKHGLSLNLVKQITEQMHDPIMVFDSATQPGSKVVMTELTHGKKTIVVAVHLSKEKGHHVVNDIASVYAKDNDKIFGKWIDDSLLRYMNKKKSREWFQTRGLQLPKVETAIRGYKSKILFDYDLVKPQYSFQPTGQPYRLGAVPLRDMVDHLAGIIKGITVEDRNGKTWIKTVTGKDVQIISVETIDKDTVAMTIGQHYGQSTTGRIAGKYVPAEVRAGMKSAPTQKTIHLVKDVAGIWTLSHEFYHFLEDIGAISNADKALLNNKIESLIKKDPETYGYLKDRSNTERRAEWVGRTLVGIYDPKTPTGRIIQKIRNIIDQVINALGIRTAAGVIRDIETGKIYDKEQQKTPENITSSNPETPQVQYALDEKTPAKDSVKASPGQVAEAVWHRNIVMPVSAAITRGVQTGLGKVSPKKAAAIKQFFTTFKEFWVPGISMPNKDVWLASRARGMGDQAQALDFIANLFNQLTIYPADIKKLMFRYLDGQIPLEVLPESIIVKEPVKENVLMRHGREVLGIWKNEKLTGPTIDKEVNPREIAKSLRLRSDAVGRLMVKLGMLQEGQFKKMEGNYVHYLYAYHILGDDVPIEVGANGKINTSILMSRKDLTPEQKKELGQIEDVSIAVPVGMGKALINIAKWHHLLEIAENPDWVWQPSLIEINIPKEYANRNSAMQQAGKIHAKDGLPYIVKKLDNGRYMIQGAFNDNAVNKTMTIGDLVKEVKIYEKMVANNPTSEVSNRYAALKETLGKIQEDMGKMANDFVQLPDSKSYGPLAGAFVRKEIAADLTPVLGAMKENMGEMVKTIMEISQTGMAAFKMGKVALNVPTMVRNIGSNVIQINLSGRSLPDVIRDGKRAATAIRDDSPYIKEAFRMGLFNTSWAAVEINDVLDQFRAAEGGRIDKVLTLIKGLAKYYGKIDDFWKFTMFLQQRESGKTIDEAAVHALKWGLDYSLVPNFVKTARQFYMPFITYQYKIAPLIAESLKKRPWVLAKYALIYPAAKMLAMGAQGLDDDDWDDLVKQLPAYIKKSGSMMILPWKTDKGQWQWVNLEYFFPWGNYLAMFRDARAADSGELLRDAGISNPFLSMFFTGLSAREDQPPLHSYFGTPIYNQLDPAPVKAAKYLEYMANTWIPSMLTRQGALGYTGKMIMGDEDRWGREVTLPQAAGRWFGLNIVSVSPEQTRAQVSVRIQDLRKEMSRIDADPSRSEEEKAAFKARLNEKLGAIAAEAPAAILPINKMKGADTVYEALKTMAEKGILHTAPPTRSMEINGIPLKMTMDQYKEYLDKSSDIAHRKLQFLIESPAWETMTDKRKGDVIEAIVSNARKGIRQKIKAEMLRDNRDKIMTEREKQRTQVS